MTMITPSYLGETIEYSSLHACRSTLEDPTGAKVYADSCARCHDTGRLASSAGGLQLPLAVALHLQDPRNLIHIVREGVRPPDGHPGRWMPGFDGALTDEQIAALAIWLRHQATDEAAWNDVPKAVQETRSPAP